MRRFKKLLIASVVGIVVFNGEVGAPVAERPAGALRPMTIEEIDRMAASGKLPYGLEELADHLRRTILHDRPELKARSGRLLQAYVRYQSEVEALRLLEETRGNVRALYDLERQRGRRQEVEDTAVIEARNRYLTAERVVVDQRKTVRLIVLEIVETVNLIEVDGHGEPTTARASGGADAR